MSEAAVKTYDFICVGTEVETLISKLQNNSNAAVSNVVVQFDVPPGVEFKSASINGVGIFDSTNLEWRVGTLKKFQLVSASILWTVTDDCLAPFKFNLQAVSDQGNVCLNSEDDTDCIVIKGLTNCQVGLYEAVTTVDTVQSPYTVKLSDQNIFIDASGGGVELILPPADEVFDANKGGSSWSIKVIDLTNSAIISSPDSPIIEFSDLPNAVNQLTYSFVGQSYNIVSAGAFYAVKS